MRTTRYTHTVRIGLGLWALAIMGLMAGPVQAAKPVKNIHPSWHQILPASERFELVMGGEAVLDNETGLVWEQSPLTTDPFNWEDARFECGEHTVGDRKGWRLPSVHELASLVDPGNPTGNPDLPAGHPFGDNVLSSHYWSATTFADNSTLAWIVQFSTGRVITFTKTSNAAVWCVRGGHNDGSEY